LLLALFMNVFFDEPALFWDLQISSLSLASFIPV
jgi:hypothetical protein